MRLRIRRSAETGAGLPFDPDELESRLVWIFGSPRTGSTWLLEQLCHPVRPDDSKPTGFAATDRGTSSPIDALPVNEFAVSLHIAPAFGDPVEVDGRLLPATLNNYLDHKPAYLFARDYEQVWRPAVRRLVLVRLFAVQAMAAQAGLPLASPMIFIKEVNGSHAADLVMSLFPRARMLFLIRDGRDVVDSRIQAVREGGWLARQQGQAHFKSDEERLSWARGAMREWACAIDATMCAYRAHARRLRRMVRYEDLIADTEGCVGSLFEWLALPRNPERVARLVAAHSFSALPAERRGPLRKRRAARPGLWRENLTDAEKAAAAEIMGSRLAELGYDE